MKTAIKIEGKFLHDGFILLIALEMDLPCSPVAAGGAINMIADVFSLIWDGTRQLLTKICPDKNSNPNLGGKFT
jgi:hypothetical protein